MKKNIEKIYIEKICHIGNRVGEGWDISVNVCGSVRVYVGGMWKCNGPRVSFLIMSLSLLDAKSSFGASKSIKESLYNSHM